MTWVLVGIGVLAVVARRFAGERVDARDLVVPVVVLLCLGGYEVAKAPLDWVDGLWVAGGSVVGFGFGVLRGATIRVFDRDGAPWQRYTPWTLGAWVLSFAANAGVGLIAPGETRSMTLSIGVGLLGEAVPVGLRALRLTSPGRR
ncbi:DUF1453 domain-containing protein [Actinosynnema sp. NPDC020468]|uniref:DUF1453 domain-containing protein n=1 Tax=Actinosynnema sp. NPDC020468 TaxID=3154488 RepID=UPI0033CB7ED7